MKGMLCMLTACVLCIAVLGAGATSAAEPLRFGIRGGIGTDINLGIAYGAGANILLTPSGNPIEVGILLFGGSFEETTEEAINTYEEKTDLFVFGILANYLVGYVPNKKSIFAVLGFGLGAINVSWEERSAGDTSLGTPLPGGGSMQSEDGSSAGTVFNVGIGGSFESGLDLRFEIPVILTFAPPGESAGVVPTAIVTAGYRF